MKNLFYSLCLLIGFTSWATSVDYHTHINSNDCDKIITIANDCDLQALFKISQTESADEAFEFDTMKYLPANFNAFAGLFEAYELVQEVEDQAFDFETEAYLPVGFNANTSYEYNITEIALVDDNVAFDFETTAYLPVGFNANATYLSNITEITTVEADELFDFNTEDYLPNNFDAHATEEYEKNISDVSNITSESL